MKFDTYVQQFKVAAGEGALCELYLRLLAARTPGLEATAVDARLEDVELGIAKSYAEHLDTDDVDALKLCRQLRNKLLHCEFHVARQRLHALGAPQQTGGVVRVELGDARGIEVLEMLREATGGLAGVVVSDSRNTTEGTVMGWFLELGASGDLASAATVFRHVSALLMRLAADTAPVPSAEDGHRP
ncbi:MAG: hypothetical protein U0230_18050 [Polyangiales bacterium]